MGHAGQYSTKDKGSKKEQEEQKAPGDQACTVPRAVARQAPPGGG